MSVKALIQNKVSRHLFSTKRRDALRVKAERQRRAKNEPHIVEYFHEAGDPYSHLIVQVLPDFCQRYDIEIVIHLVGAPADAAAPDRARLQSYGRIDAARLARRAGLSFSDPGHQPSDQHLAEANAAFVRAIEDGTFLQQAVMIGDLFWGEKRTDFATAAPVSVKQVMAAGTQRRETLGHYLGGTLHYGGEWYWGVDRLHYLERRLQDLGAAREGISDLIFAPPVVPSGQRVPATGARPELHWYLSFRSPYTGIVADRVKTLADAYGAELKLRYVLPMVMRGMQVPRAKGFYIMRDTVREGERLGVPFGNSCDPVGRPVERGYAVLHRAIEQGKGFEFVQSFLSGVWSEGINAGSDGGLRKLIERAGLSWSEMKPLLSGDHWRATAEANQQEMFQHGVWGVPSFRVGDTTAWGQDRLWVIEEALQAVTGSENNNEETT